MSTKAKIFSEEIVHLWKDHNAPDAAYFDKAETEDWTREIWGQGSVFKKFLNEMNLKTVVEIACGRGRHAANLIDISEELYLIDTSTAAIEFARKRFGSLPKVKVILSDDGKSLPSVPENYITAVYSFDAMVHFEPLTIADYLVEIERVLCTGGRALLHHSNYDQNPTGKIIDAPGWRNYMTKDLFSHLASRAGLKVIDQGFISWCGPESDALTLLEK